MKNVIASTNLPLHDEIILIIVDFGIFGLGQEEDRKDLEHIFNTGCIGNFMAWDCTFKVSFAIPESLSK